MKVLFLDPTCDLSQYENIDTTNKSYDKIKYIMFRIMNISYFV